MKKADAKVTIEMDRGDRRIYDRLRAGIVARRHGRHSSARDLLLLDDSPQKHGNLLLARQLRKRMEHVEPAAEKR